MARGDDAIAAAHANCGSRLPDDELDLAARAAHTARIIAALGLLQFLAESVDPVLVVCPGFFIWPVWGDYLSRLAFELVASLIQWAVRVTRDDAPSDLQPVASRNSKRAAALRRRSLASHCKATSSGGSRCFR